MTFKRLLSVIDVRHSDEDLKTAIQLCGEVDAQLAVMVVALAPLPAIGDYPIGTAAILEAQRDHDLAALSKRVDEIKRGAEQSGISAMVIDEYPEARDLGHVVGRHARYADAAVLCSGLLSNEQLRVPTIEGALFESGKPLVIVPHGSKPTLYPNRVLLAWNSGVECTRAAREALDLMRTAQDVHVTIIDPDVRSNANGPEPGADIANYLARHEIRAAVDCLPSGGYAIADIIKRHAIDISADLIVMGGYGRSRMRERIFGGVTRSMLEDPSLPVLIAR